MKTINIDEELQEWLVNYLINAIHGLESDDLKFNQWAKSYPRKAVDLIVCAEFDNDWGYGECREVTEEEAKQYAEALLQRIVNTWYL